MSTHTRPTSSTTLVEALQAALPAGRVQSTPEDLAVYGYDGTWALGHPDAVVSPESAAEVAIAMRVAAGLGVPVVPRGGGTGLAGGSVPTQGGVVINMTRMNRILEIDAANMTATVQPGVVTARLQ
ncbi:MAG: FAD-binding oxidoreductase, partial [Chloroflexota bacterium]